MFVMHRPQQGPAESFHYPELISVSAGKESCPHRQWEFLLHTVLALGPAKKTSHSVSNSYWHVKEPVLCNFSTAPFTIWGGTLSIRGSADYPTCSADRPLHSISISLLKGDSRNWLLLLYSVWAGWDIFRLLPFFPLSSCNHTLSPLRTPGASVTDSDHKALWNDNWSFVGF